jgi:hypothetical protein
VSIALGVGACAMVQKHRPGVSFHETFVQIYPGTKISSADQKKLDAVLGQFSRSLYKIRTYDRGTLVKTQGRLGEDRMDQVLVTEAINAAQAGVSNTTLEIGIAAHPNWPAASVHPNRQKIGVPVHPNIVGVPSHPETVGWAPHPNLTNKEYRDCKRLVSRVAPILRKYSQ